MCRTGTASRVVTIVGIWLLWVAPAFAGIAIVISPGYPSAANVGQMHIPVSMIIINASSDDPGNPGVDSVRPVTIDTSLHTPACDFVNGSGTCPVGSREPDVFAIDATVTPTGQAGGGLSGCVGTWTIGPPDPLTGEVTFTPPGGPGTLVLGGASLDINSARCTVIFGVDVSMLPINDADLGTPGIQTDQLVRATGHFSDDPLLVGSGTGSDQTTIGPSTITATPTATATPPNPTPTDTPTDTSTNTPTAVPTDTPTATSTSTPTAAPSSTSVPTSKDQCSNGGWKALGFKNQGQCNKVVNAGG